jgi:hypothetical protein
VKALLLLLVLPSCHTGATWAFNPETRELRVERSWLGGPFYCEFEYEHPDGTRISGIVQSDVNLDAAVQRVATQTDVISKALDKIPNAGAQP